MKKILLSIFVLLLIFVIACQQAAPKDAMEKKEDVMQEKAPVVDVTGESAVDSVGNGLNDASSVEKDLGTDELADLDSGLSDIQNI